MSLLVRCTVCGEKATLESHHAALQAGWRFAEIRTKERVLYTVACPKDRLDWMERALREADKPAKPKDREAK